MSHVGYSYIVVVVLSSVDGTGDVYFSGEVVDTVFYMG